MSARAETLDACMAALHELAARNDIEQRCDDLAAMISVIRLILTVAETAASIRVTDGWEPFPAEGPEAIWREQLEHGYPGQQLTSFLSAAVLLLSQDAA
jgi:hypothetical protein